MIMGKSLDGESSVINAHDDDGQMNENNEMTPCGDDDTVVENNGQLVRVDSTLGDERTPKNGMLFRSYEEVLNFFKRYALRVGFGVCVKKSSFSKAGLCRQLVLVCNKWGNGREDACYQARPTAKTNCQASVVARLGDDGLLHLTDVNLEHNHTLNPSSARFLRCYKTLPSGMSKDLVVRAARGEHAASDMEIPISDEWGRLKLEEGDVEALNQFFAQMQMKQPNFFYVMDFYVEGYLRNVFWADSRSREVCQYFNDAILIDTTCLRDKFKVPLVVFVGVNNHCQQVLLGCGLLSDDSTESFLWLLKSWQTCMKGTSPSSVVTDECKALKAAVREVFPKVRHRICLWRIMKTVNERLGEVAQSESFKEDLGNAVYMSLKEDEFEERWNKMIDRFGLDDSEWLCFLYENRHLWAPAFLKDTFWAGLSTVQRLEELQIYFEGAIGPETSLVSFLGNYLAFMQGKYLREIENDHDSYGKRSISSKLPYIEEQISKLYTMNAFNKFQDELKSTANCQVHLTKVDGSCSTFAVEDFSLSKVAGNIQNRIYEVLYCGDNLKIECNCGNFQFTGIVCRHALSVMKFQQMYEMPAHYVLNRWRVDYKQLYAHDHPLMDVMNGNPVDRYDFISLQCLRLVEFGTSDEKYDLALKLIAEIKKNLLNDDLCREWEKKLAPLERSVMNGNVHGMMQPGSLDGGPPKKRRGRPPKKGKDTAVDAILGQSGNKDLGIANGTQKDAFHSSSTATNIPTQLRAHGVVDLMVGQEDVSAHDLSFDGGHYSMIPTHQQHHYGNQLHPGNTLQFVQPVVENASRMQQWIYPEVLQENQVPQQPFGRRP